MTSTQHTTKLLSRVRAHVERGERIATGDVAALFSVVDTSALARIARIPRERRFGHDAFHSVAQHIVYRGGSVPGGLDSSLPIALEPAGHRATLESLQALSRRLNATDIVVRVSTDWLAMMPSPIDVVDAVARMFPSVALIDACDGPLDRELHLEAHRRGVASTVALRYSAEDDAAGFTVRVETLRALQDESRGIHSVVMIPEHDEDEKATYLAAPTAHQSLRATAIARIALDNIEHIAVVPDLITAEVAYVALSYGADSIDSFMRPAEVASIELPVIGAEQHVSTPNDVDVIASRIVEARYLPRPIDQRTRTEQHLAAPQH